MNQFNIYFNQLSNLCIWLNINTKIKAGIIYEKDSIHVELIENDTPLYTHLIEGLNVKSEDRINLELTRLIQFLLNLKEEQLEITNNENK